MAHLVPMQRQKGVVLIVALIMVVAVTGIAVSLMSSSSIDIKVTNAVQEREMAENELIGTVQKVIAREAAKGSASSFLLDKDEVPKTGENLGDLDGVTNTLTNLNNGELDLPCPRRFSFTAGMSCNMLQVDSTITYGSKSKHTITITSGIAQEMVSLNTGG